jgi:hypothetical protein
MTKNSDIARRRSRDRSKALVSTGTTAPGIVGVTQTRVFEDAVSLVQRLHPLFAAAAVGMMLRSLSFVLPIDLDPRGILVDA